MPGVQSDQIPRFAQLYFFDTENELQNRMQYVSKLKPDVLEILQSTMHCINLYVQAFRQFASMVQTSNIPDIRMVITEKRTNGWQYLAPTGAEVAAIMPGQGDESNIACMMLPQNSLQGLIDCIYGDLETLSCHATFFKDRAILAPRNKDVDAINNLVLQKFPGTFKEYVSADLVCESDCDSILFTTEFLNSLDLGGGFPPHVLHLKQNAPVMLLRNLDLRSGLCNGTCLICKQFHSKVIEAEIITGSHAGKVVFIPRIDFLMETREGLPFELKRRQFPLRCAFGMTINKAQGQTLGVLRLYLPTPVFTHGQLYVAMSRVKSSSTIKVVVGDGGDQRTYTSNIVYKELLQLTSS
ncbi:hypothetical protein L7F22_003978 [Adiantum nelumboides]|nr:hypothetical protein [Adiantum nelumboides]